MRPRLLLGVLVLALASCGGEDEGAPTTVQSPARERVLVYFLREGKVWPVARRVVAEQPHAAALRELLRGPTAEERELGLTTDASAGEQLEVRVRDGVASVSGTAPPTDSFLAQVVYTLTQFPSADTVNTGTTEVTRRAFEELTPAILVESPAVGDDVASPFGLRGTANTFEATFQYEVLAADGSVLAENFVTATSGSGTRGTFDETVAFQGGPAATLVVFEISAEDGSRMNVVEIPLQ
jgi:germination protein M